MPLVAVLLVLLTPLPLVLAAASTLGVSGDPSLPVGLVLFGLSTGVGV